ncbi:MAG TPA: hypothetical protein VFL89_00220 [Solirubrobacterales bacterium]|nr:hypothetical protein [Solirubrobacterales bacterium]
MVDEGPAIHYSAVQRGTPVYSAEGSEVGVVEAVLDNYREHIFDGVVFKDLDGVLRFADAPEVARTAERAVTLTLGVEEARQLGPPEKGSTRLGPSSGGRLGRLFGGARKRNR